MILCDRKSLNFGCIYKLTYRNPNSKYNNRIYIGQTKSLTTRLNGYKNAFKRKGSAKQRWINMLQSKDDVYDFYKYFDIEVQQYVEDEYERDKAEIFWIEKLDARNSKIGFNTQIGGRGHAPLNVLPSPYAAYMSKISRNAYCPHPLQSYFIYDNNEDDVDYVFSMHTMKTYGMTQDEAYDSMVTKYLVSGRYMVYHYLFSQRNADMVKFYMEKRGRINEIDRNLEGGKPDKRHAGVIINSLIRHVKLYIHVEEIILNEYSHLGKDVVITDKRIEYWKSQLKQLLHLQLKYVNIVTKLDYNLNDKSSVPNVPVLVYDVLLNKIVSVHDNIEDAIAAYNGDRIRTLMKMKKVVLLKKRYFFYYGDIEILDEMYLVLKNKVKKLDDKSLWYKYNCGYFAARDILMPRKFIVKK